MSRAFLILFILLILPLISLFHPGLPITHDGQDHVARIANFYLNLEQGNFVPRWAGNLNWGYGHPILEFLYPFSSYFASLVHFLGFSLVDSVKVVFGLGFFLSGLFMYLWLSSFLKRDASLFGTVLYVYAPYRFVDLYVRGAIGENSAFIWLPLLLLFTYKLSKNQNLINVFLASFTFALLILSHNALSLVFLPFVVFYGIYLGMQLKNKKRFFSFFLILIILGLTLSAFFWIPSLMEGKYTLRSVVRTVDFSDRFASLSALVWGPWSFGVNGKLTVQLGIVNWLALLFSPYLLFKLYKEKNRAFLLIAGLIIYSLAAIFLMTNFSTFFWKHIPFLWDFQFPWRLLSITVFSTAVLGALLINEFSNNLRKIIITFGILIIVLISSGYWNANGYLNKNEAFFTGIYNSTTDTGESAPIWSVRFMEQRWNNPLEVIDGNAVIKNISRSQTLHKYKIQVNKRTLFRENTLYFPGWEISANGKVLPLEFQNMNYRGIMTFYLDKGDYSVSVNYKETKIRNLSNMVSLIGLVIIVLFPFVLKWQKNYR